MKRKSQEQLKALEEFYSDQKFPTSEEMKAYAKRLGLSYKEISRWFTERRKKDRKKNGCILPCIKETEAVPESNTAAGRSSKRQDSLLCNRSKSTSSVTKSRSNEKKLVLQDLLPPKCILDKVFQKDGPPLGVEFDSLPLVASRRHKASWLKASLADQEKQRVTKKRKVSELVIEEPPVNIVNSVPVKQHGIGKGLMTVWRVVNPDGQDLPPGVASTTQGVACFSKKPASTSRKPRLQKKRTRQLASILKEKRMEKKSKEKKRPPIVRKQASLNKDQGHKAFKCELALDGELFEERSDLLRMLAEDEELEMKELQARPNLLAGAAHSCVSGSCAPSLCKDLLPKFPPNSVKMKPPFGLHPWRSSPESVKKLFKAFHFLYTYSLILDLCPFTLDEFAQSFHNEDSLLLGKVHLCLLKLLLQDVKRELQRGVYPNLSISCKFLALLHSVESQSIILQLWENALNPLTWAEILRQISVAAGFGSSQAAVQTEAPSKETRFMIKYGLRRGTLKGELFILLYEQSNNGLRVSDLANHSQVAELNVASSTDELEAIISSTLSSDMTLFEKISPSTYRLRTKFFSEEADEDLSDYEDAGSVDNEPNDASRYIADYDSECNSENLSLSILRDKSGQKHKSKRRKVHIEIDESHRGEPWLLGLIEGEYSDLSIEEKLDLLVALIDLLSAGSTIRMEDPGKISAECVPRIYGHGSGAKIKRAASTQHSVPRLSWIHGGQPDATQEASASSVRPVDSSSVRSFFELQKSSANDKFAKDSEVNFSVHPMQSVWLGSDRRYNRYWLFLGPCNAIDPGHRSIYFESSEDGHWEVIDSEEVLRILLSVLDDRGIREAQLIDSLEKREASLCQAMSRQVTQLETSQTTDIVREDSSSPLSGIDNNQSLVDLTNDSLSSRHGAIVLEVGKKRDANSMQSCLQEFDSWIWVQFYSNLSAVKHGRRSYLDSLTRCESCHDLYWRDEKHCKICHTTFELDIDLEERYAIHAATCRKKGDKDASPKKVLSSRLQSLKAAIHAIESAMPQEALIGAWRKSAHRLWVKRLRRTSSLSELLQVIGDFVGAINVDWLWQSGDEHSNVVMEEIISCFPAMPQTSSAVALWLVNLDTLVAPFLEKAQPMVIQENGTRRRSRRACCKH